MSTQTSRNPATLIVQLTDTHIVANARLCLNEIDTSSFLRAAVETVRHLTVRPDAVLITGDLVNEGRANQYEHLKVLLAPIVAAGMPLYLMPGNHDSREAMREVFPDHGELGKGPSCDFVADIGALRLIGLDTLVDNEPGGDLSERQLAWLERTLQQKPNRPTVIAMHHPPFETGIGHMDEQGLAPDARAAMERIVSAHPQVERVTCGHLHRSVSRRWAGTIAATTPSVAHAVAFDLRPGAHGAWNYEPPSITAHHWNGSHLVTHQIGSGDFPAKRYGM